MKQKLVNWWKNNRQRLGMTMVMVMCCVAAALAADSVGSTAISSVRDEIYSYIPAVTNLIYAIAGVVTLVGAISVYVKMNNEEQDVKKSIMLIVGADIFLVAAAKALPMFFES